MKPTPYIARTDGGDTILELRVAALDDIAEAERGKWRAVMEQPASVDSATQARSLTFTVNGDNPVVMRWAAQDLPPAWGAMQLKQLAADKRWQMETGGLLIAGIETRTDDAAQRKIAELRRRVEAGEIATPFMFKAVNGWVALDAAAIAAVDRAVAQHVQRCYRAEKAAIDAIEAGTVRTSDAVENLMDGVA